ncbi:MAG: heavy-metal-associated domain-containing protein [Nanoarchaeota archaeon]|nr:heavy-metal-associated domain-containing protein [Nanoarchaeota archaeon]
MKKILKIQGMHCSGCATGLEILLNTKGIKAKVDFDSKKAEVEFNPDKISLEKIKKEIENVGYKVK